MANKVNIKTAHKTAKEKGGVCLSEELASFTSKEKLRWKCRMGHEWEARASHVIHDGTWCPTCSRKPDSIERMHKIAKSRGGKCLSEQFVNHHTKLMWECGEGHQWEAVPTAVVHRKSWCPYCAGKNQTLDDLKQIATERGGRCLSEEYKGAHFKYKWECREGHRWSSTASSVKSSTWCVKCVRNKNALKRRIATLKKVRQVALAKGGECLSTIKEYDRSQAPVKLRCQAGHEWSCLPGSIISVKSWCPKCYVPKLKRTIEEMRVIARKRGGECLSKEYVETAKPLLWRCEVGHEFKLSAKLVINKNSWCPECRYQKLSLSDAINLAREKGGLCLSRSVKSTSSLIRWECSQGHEWRTNYFTAKEKWCEECSILISNFALKHSA